MAGAEYCQVRKTRKLNIPTKPFTLSKRRSMFLKYINFANRCPTEPFTIFKSRYPSDDVSDPHLVQFTNVRILKLYILYCKNVRSGKFWGLSGFMKGVFVELFFLLHSWPNISKSYDSLFIRSQKTSIVWFRGSKNVKYLVGLSRLNIWHW